MSTATDQKITKTIKKMMTLPTITSPECQCTAE